MSCIIGRNKEAGEYDSLAFLDFNSTMEHQTRFIGKNRQEIILLLPWQNREKYVMILFVCEYIKRSQVSKFRIYYSTNTSCL